MLVVEFKEQLFFDKALRFLAEALKTIALALLLSLLALVGACVGTVIGAFKGHGAAIGAIAGAAVALQIVSCTASGQRYYCLSRVGFSLYQRLHLIVAGSNNGEPDGWEGVDELAPSTPFLVPFA
ncbi:NEP1-interacting protein-like 2 isoform X2 [Cucumis melo var. makuwa]|uniref:NEP1-interacting protein-like 2 isoform X2 n=1 Tax=Cucumis melo var. makuwa TaxID=1194695 RepID=A0A5D3DI33_CUCMM|nr:NEP1-interacting protein-like 2 isoform X2 [Cucumis melo var. makuwa]